MEYRLGLSGKMEASEEHMLSEHRDIKKMDSTVLECFTALADSNEELRREAGVKLLEHVYSKQIQFQVRQSLNAMHVIVYFIAVVSCRLSCIVPVRN
jgi:hypothetical protein